MTEQYSTIHLKGKRKKVALSNWELPQLSDKQIEYAANDAFFALDLFIIFFEKMIPTSCVHDKMDYIQKNAFRVCGPWLDEPFRENSLKNKFLNTSVKENAMKSRRKKRNLVKKILKSDQLKCLQKI